MTSILLLALICVAATVNSFYYIVVFSPLYKRFTLRDQPQIEMRSYHVDIVVVVKNELLHLKRLIPTLLNQNYPYYTITIMNDFSDDGTEDYIQSLGQETIRLLKPSKDSPGKKLALKEAIASSIGEVILLTDGDCIPASQDWVLNMVAGFADDHAIVLGYSPTEKTHGLLNAFVRYETWLTATQYLSYAQARIPYMGVGRNMAYLKTIGDKYAPDYSVLSGDDDLLVQQFIGKVNINIEVAEESFVFTQSPSSLVSFLRQKTRHVATSIKYDTVHQILLGLFSASHIIQWLIFAYLVAIGQWLSYGIIFFILSVLVRWFISFRLMGKMELKQERPYYPLFEIALALYYCIIPIIYLFKGKPTKWN